MQENDLVNHPDHYTVGGIETIEIQKAKATLDEFRGHLRLTAVGYLLRAPFKENALRDYKKAVWYLNRLIKEMEAQQVSQVLCPGGTFSAPMPFRGTPFCQTLTPTQVQELLGRMPKA